MTDEQIIKALECCVTDDGDDCFQCPYGDIVYKPGNGGCVNRCHKDALDLIGRQKTEAERLKSRNKFLEIECKNVNNLFEARVQAAIKEFAERLKKSDEFYNCIRAIGSVSRIDCLIDTFDNLVKEMTEVEE